MPIVLTELEWSVVYRSHLHPNLNDCLLSTPTSKQNQNLENPTTISTTTPLLELNISTQTDTTRDPMYHTSRLAHDLVPVAKKQQNPSHLKFAKHI